MAERVQRPDPRDFVGWEVMSAIEGAGVVQVRCARPLSRLFPWVQVRGVLAVDLSAMTWDGPGWLGERIVQAGESIRLGTLEIDDESVVGTWLVDSALLVSKDPVDPFAEPAECIFGLRSAELVWPSLSGQASQLGPQRLIDATMGAFGRPSLAATVGVDAGNGLRMWDLMVSGWTAIELERHPGTDDPVAVCFFSVLDVPARLMERSGLGRLLSVGEPGWWHQSVSVRSVFSDDRGLVMGSLEWEEHDGRLTSSSETRTPMSIMSEMLSMLPG